MVSFSLKSFMLNRKVYGGCLIWPTLYLCKIVFLLLQNSSIDSKGYYWHWHFVFAQCNVDVLTTTVFSVSYVVCNEQIRIQHEVYPDNTLQASRQVLIINDVEIRDRLALSKINKFLYQYSSDAVPRQSHASMVWMSSVYSLNWPVTVNCVCWE